MPTGDETYGKIDISANVVATIANQAVHQCYGVVGMARRSMVNGIAQLLSRDSRRGIDVRINDVGVEVDIYVIVQYGVRIRAVAESIQNTVKFHVEKALGMPVIAVNVYVQGLKVSQEVRDEFE